MSDNMDCPRVDLPCTECERIIVDAEGIGAIDVDDDTLVMCLKCAKEESDFWEQRCMHGITFEDTCERCHSE